MSEQIERRYAGGPYVAEAAFDDDGLIVVASIAVLAFIGAVLSDGNPG